MPWGIVARPTLVSLATARVVNRVWIKILGQLMHIVLFATAVTTRLQRKFTPQRTASASGQRFARPTFATLKLQRGRCRGLLKLTVMCLLLQVLFVHKGCCASVYRLQVLNLILGGSWDRG